MAGFRLPELAADIGIIQQVTFIVGRHLSNTLHKRREVLSNVHAMLHVCRFIFVGLNAIVGIYAGLNRAGTIGMTSLA